MHHHPSVIVLPPLAFPLANHLYRANRSRMRARGHHQVLVLRAPDICAALCLQPISDGYWLTNLLVDAQHRNQGHARHLLAEARGRTAGPIWLFCHPELEELYGSAGYHRCSILPPVLSARLARYRLHKPLISMVNPR